MVEEAETQRGPGAHPRLHSQSVGEPDSKFSLLIPSSMFFTSEWHSRHSGDQELKIK